MRSVRFQRERFTDAFDDALPLLEQHRQEIAHFQDILLDVDVRLYCNADVSDRLRVYTARDGDRLVGYACYFVGSNPHYQASKQAKQDVLYLHPDYRAGRTGLRLVEFADAQLAIEGVQCVYHHVKDAHPALGRILGFLGYEPVERVYVKRLDRKG
ncbi:MAG: GNAT family N-acetyltransferase [bacterium]|jgi:GNAT superfamily N-acetyltransferase